MTKKNPTRAKILAALGEKNQQELAKILGVSQGALSRWVRQEPGGPIQARVEAALASLYPGQIRIAMLGAEAVADEIIAATRSANPIDIA